MKASPKASVVCALANWALGCAQVPAPDLQDGDISIAVTSQPLVSPGYGGWPGKSSLPRQPAEGLVHASFWTLDTLMNE